MLVHFLRDGRRCTGLSKEEFEEMSQLLSERSCSLYSSDYFTMYFPLTAIIDDEEKAVGDELVFNKRYEFDTFMGAPNYGRLLVSLNPKMNEYFKDVVFTNVVEPGEFISIEARARKKMSLEELEAALPWLFRISAIQA